MAPDEPGFPDDPDELVITFDMGTPVAIDGETVTMLEAVQQLNLRAGAYGLSGREAYQGPGAPALAAAHHELAKVCVGQVSGEVDLVLHRGHAVVNSSRSEESMYGFTTGDNLDRSIA